jgi:hypothetical protein
VGDVVHRCPLDLDKLCRHAQHRKNLRLWKSSCRLSRPKMRFLRWIWPGLMLTPKATCCNR